MLKTLWSILTLKCPNCQTGNLFEGFAYNPKKTINMPHACPKCGQPFFLEPGFYFGAMFVSYMLNVGIGLTIFASIWGIYGGFQKPIFLRCAYITMGILLMLFPLILRLSRSIWLYVFYRGKTTFYNDTDKPNTGQ